MNITHWTHRTTHGLWSIRPHAGRFHVWFNDEPLDHFHTPQNAAEELAFGHSAWPSSGLDPSKCAIPSDLSDWVAHARQ